jgi:tetratricopeptide (TPR) repeat protein
VTSWSSTNESSEKVGASSATVLHSETRRRRSKVAEALLEVATWTGVAVVVAAPLVAGTVHRIPLITVLAVTAATIAVFVWSTERRHRPLRFGPEILLPLAFLLIPLIQSVPLPLGLRALLDPKGTSLLTEATLGTVSSAPLSLDPPSTRAHIGRAAAALVIFVLSYHLGSGQRRRHLFLRAIAAAGIASVVIGLGHKIFGIGSIYGVLSSTHRTLLIGPFVNSNHTAELLELSAFACLAASFQRPDALNRIGWLIGMLVCVGGAAGTLSRGAVAALGAGVLVFVLLRYLSKDEEGPRRRRVAFAWGLFLVGLIVLSAAAIGVRELLSRFQAGALAGDVRFRLWRDSLNVLDAHPMGIGRGAFDRVFPVYQTMKTPLSIRFAFVENHPLQLLIDGGWFLFALLAAAGAFVVWQIVRRGRRDKTEAALVAGLAAVAVHSLVDFGLETLGVLFPFMAVLGTVLGRMRPADAARPRPGLSAWIAATASVALSIGVGSIAHASYDDFDKLLKATPTSEGRRQVLERAQKAHPIDYYYPLVYARLEPLKAARGAPSPRFHALNRALMLCSSCEAVHIEVARNLWQLGLRRQALMEWRTAVTLQPQLFTTALGEVFAAGATPLELATLGTFDGARMVDVAVFLSSVSRVEEAFVVLEQAETLGAPSAELLLTRGRLQLQAGRAAEASVTLARAHALGVRDPRLARLDAELVLATRGASAADEVLAILDGAATANPLDLGLQRMRLDVVMKYEKWQAAERALEGLKQALYRTQGSAVEAHIAAARLYTRLGRWTNALGEYRIALVDVRSDVSLWMEYGHAAELAGRGSTAREAYAEAARLNPKDPEVAKALGAIDAELARLRGQHRQNAEPLAAMESIWFATLVSTICLEGLGRKYLPQIPAVAFYFLKDVVLILGLWRFRRTTTITRTGRYLYRGFGVALAVAFAWTVLELFNPMHESFLLGLIGLRAYWLWWLAPFVIAGTLQNPTQKRRAIYVLLVMAVGISLLAVVQFAAPPDASVNLYSVVDGEEVYATVAPVAATGRARVSSTFSFLSGFQDFTILIPTLLLSIGLDAKEPRLRRTAFIATMLSAAVVPMSGSRAAVLLGASVILITAWTAGLFFTRIGRRIVIGGVAAVVLALFAFPDAFIGVQSRFANVEETATRYQGVATILPPVAMAVTEFPAAGLGTGMQQNARASLGIRPSLEEELEPGRYLVELGPVGYLAMWTAKLGLIFALLRAYRILKRAGRRGAAAAALSYAVLTMNGNLTFDHIWQALYFIGSGFILAEVIAVQRANRPAPLQSSGPPPVATPALVADGAGP